MSSTIEYYDTVAGSWKELSFSKWKHTRDIESIFDTLEFTTDKSNQSTLEPNLEIRMKIDGSIWFGGCLRDSGEQNEKGTVSVTVFGYGAELMRKRFDKTYSSTTNEAIVNDITITGTYEDGNKSYSFSSSGATIYSISSYSINDKGGAIAHEMQNFYAWVWYIESFTDGSGNFAVSGYYLPKGYYSSGETIDTTGQATQLKKYTPNITEEVITDVEVTGTDSNGVEHTMTSSGTNSFGVERFQRVTVDYLSSDTEAQNIADQIKQTSAYDKVEVDVFWYKTNLVNETLTLNAPERNISSKTFLVVKQSTTYPEKRTELTLETLHGVKKDWFAMTHERELEVRKERARILSDISTDVGVQTLNVGSADANTSTSSSCGSADANTSTSSSCGSADANTSTSSSCGSADANTSGSGDCGTADANTSSTTSETANYSGWSSWGTNFFSIVTVDNTWTQLETIDTDSDLLAFEIGITPSAERGTGFMVELLDSNDNPVYRSYFANMYFTDSLVLRIAGALTGAQIFTLRMKFCGTDSVDVDGWITRYDRESHTHSVSTSITPGGHGSSADATEHAIGVSTTPGGHGSSADATEHGISSSNTSGGHGSSLDASEHAVTSSNSSGGHGSSLDASEHGISSSNTSGGHGSSADASAHGGDTDSKNIDTKQLKKKDRN